MGRQDHGRAQGDSTGSVYIFFGGPERPLIDERLVRSGMEPGRRL